jgi:putative zinc finger/helix-turn-helix YgiT family protein
MQCPTCDSKKPMKSEAIVHRFKESGLDNVILHGVKQYRCSHCGEVLYDYGNINQLNQVIADTLLRKKAALTGKEIRFLRTYIGYSGELFARIIGLKDKTSLSRIENGRSKVSDQVNMAVRFAVAGKMADRDYDLHDLIESIENERLLSFKDAEFKASPKGNWQLQAS